MATSTTTTKGREGEEMINITVDFTGGLELLFANIQSHKITIPSHVSTSTSSSTSTSTKQPTKISNLITHLVENVMQDSRRELFVLTEYQDQDQDQNQNKDNGNRNGEVNQSQNRCSYSIRPGILVLINDADWELEGEEEYVLRDGDGVLFVSTLHGG